MDFLMANMPCLHVGTCRMGSNLTSSKCTLRGHHAGGYVDSCASVSGFMTDSEQQTKSKCQDRSWKMTDFLQNT